MIHRDSCHPAEHKLAGVNYLVNRITTYLMAAIRKEREVRICQHILNSNGFHHISIFLYIKANVCVCVSVCMFKINSLTP
jgi:hypothetical protein